jgi:hypothetical protein
VSVYAYVYLCCGSVEGDTFMYVIPMSYLHSRLPPNSKGQFGTAFRLQFHACSPKITGIHVAT